MSKIPTADELNQTFEQADENIRAILVQNDGGFLKLVQHLPPTSSDSIDKDDFIPILSKLFGNDLQKSGYALYRLDSKAASGEWEWLCCAYQPDGAKVKEKMQYTITRTSLLEGLGEHRLLDTIFGNTPTDFLWPSKLRNSRKHDYQNPQLKAKGVAASEAAGTGVGGARRNFEKISDSHKPTSTPSPLNQESTELSSSEPNSVNGTLSTDPSSSDESKPAVSSDVQLSVTASSAVPDTEVAGDHLPIPVPAASSPVPGSEAAGDHLPIAAPAPSIKRYDSHQFTLAFKHPSLPDSDVANEGASESEKEVASPQSALPPTDDDSQPTPTAQESEEKTHTLVVQDNQQQDPGSTAAVTSSAVEQQTMSSEETEPTLVEQDNENGYEQVTEQQPADTEADSMTEGETMAEKEKDPEPTPKPESVLPPPSKVSTVSVGTGRGPSQSVLTEKEERLEAIKQHTETLSGYSGGGPKLGFKWADGVREGIQGLASTISGTSEWNLVVLSIDLNNELLQLESPPRFVLPADLPSALSDSEPRIAFYRLDDTLTRTAASSDSGESVVVMLYCCPSSSGVKARMIYSANVLIILNHVKSFCGMRVVKKIEASDRADLTHSYIVEEVEQVQAQERHKFAGTGFDGIVGGGLEREPIMISKVEPAGFARPKKAAASVRR